MVAKMPVSNLWTRFRANNVEVSLELRAAAYGVTPASGKPISAAQRRPIDVS
jgi:hypothetical protein